MNRIILFLLILVITACKQNDTQVTQQKIDSASKELKALYDADQADRKVANIDWSVVSERDEERQKRVIELLDSNLIVTSDDYANAAMIFQHGLDTFASGMAVKLMRKAIELDPDRNKWLLAAAIDRDLMKREKPQIYGTQYSRIGADAPWVIYNLDSTQVTDEERKEYGVETLAEQRQRLIMMNKKKLNELLESGKSIAEIVEMVKSADLKNSEYDLSEGGVNIFGYQLMTEGKDEEALMIFKMNTELYPEGFNTYDSYGECLMKVGQKEEAVAAYKKSLVLNPNNDNAKKVLEEMGKEEI